MRGQVVTDIEKEFLDPAFRYLVNNGLENTSIRDLCKVMNVSYGSIYYWFDGKDDVYISSVKYGIGKVAKNLFGFAFENMDKPEKFFGEFLETVDLYKAELKLITQVAASPVYGDRIREKADEFHKSYGKYIEDLATQLGCEAEELTPIIYMIISVLVDYVVWEDYEISRMQMKTLYDLMMMKLPKKE